MASLALGRGLSGGRVDAVLSASAPNKCQVPSKILLIVATLGFGFLGDALCGLLDARLELGLK
jgi:hypothetical protein